ncbi:MAG: hypothetical protein WBF53_08910, partial [Litorimonas sp.]
MKKPSLLAAAAVLTYALTFPLVAQEAETQTPEAEAPAPSPNAIVEQAAPDEWVAIAPEDLLVMTLAPDA